MPAPASQLAKAANPLRPGGRSKADIRAQGGCQAIDESQTFAPMGSDLEGRRSAQSAAQEPSDPDGLVNCAGKLTEHRCLTRPCLTKKISRIAPRKQPIKISFLMAICASIGVNMAPDTKSMTGPDSRLSPSMCFCEGVLDR